MPKHTEKDKIVWENLLLLYKTLLNACTAQQNFNYLTSIELKREISNLS